MNDELESKIEDVIEEKVEESLKPDADTEFSRLIDKKIEKKLRKGNIQAAKTNKHNHDKISRRSFLKKIGAGVGGLGALSLLPSAAAELDIRDSTDFFGNIDTNGNTITDSTGQPVNINADQLDSYDVQKNGNDTNGVINFNTKRRILSIDGEFLVGGFAIFFFGGQGSSQDNVQKISPKPDNISEKPSDLQNLRYKHTSDVVDKSIYIVGGKDGSGLAFDVLEYDVENDFYTRKSNVPSPLREHASAVVNDKIYILGGISAGARDTIYEYDPSTDNWSTKSATLPTVNYSAAAAAVDGKIYHLGGDRAGDKIYEYDPSTDTISTQSATLPTQLKQGVAEAVDGKIYHISGENSNNRTIGQIYEYDPSTDTVTTQSGTIKRKNAASAVADGKIYVIGGYLRGSQDDILEYDPSTDTASTLFSTLPQPRENGSAATLVVPDV